MAAASVIVPTYVAHAYRHDAVVPNKRHNSRSARSNGSIPGITCEGETADNAVYLTANAGDTLIPGTCEAGWTGAPRRNCTITGQWVDVATSVPCTRTPLPNAV